MKDCSYSIIVFIVLSFSYIPSGAIDTHEQRHKQLIFYN